jgi:hypothetical protein
MTTFGFLVYAALVIIGCVGDIAFLIIYTIKSRPRWWHNPVSAHVFAFSALFGVLYIRTLIRLFDSSAQAAIMSQSLGNIFFAYFVSTAAAVVVWWRFMILLTALREERKEREAKR